VKKLPKSWRESNEPPQYIVYEPVECPNDLPRLLALRAKKRGGVLIPVGLTDAEVLAAYRAAQPPAPPPAEPQ
jgi:hypothetical protein